MYRLLLLITLFATLACNKKDPEIKDGNVTNSSWSWQTPQFQSLDIDGNVETFVGFPGDSNPVDGFGHYAAFQNPVGVATDGVSLYVADGFGHTIRKVSIATGEVTTFAGTADQQGTSDGIGVDARFNYPWMIATDGTNLYVTDSSETVRVINIATRAVTTLAGSPGLSGSADGVGSAARFTSLNGITTDGTNVYLVDAGNNTIRKIVISSRLVSTLAGLAGASGSVDGIGSAARFDGLGSIVTDGTSLYLTDSANNSIRMIDLATSRVRTIAGDPNLPAAHVDGTGRFARFRDPYGITLDKTHLYVTSANGCTLRKINKSSYVVKTIAGADGDCSTVTDGISGAARFAYPLNITTDGLSLFSVEDTVIRKID